MGRNTRVMGLLLAVIAAGTAACGGGDSGHDRADYVAIMGGDAEGFTEEEADCVSAATVDAIGVDTLEEADAFDKIQDNPDGSLSDYGITLTEEQTGALYDGLNECKDLRAFFEETLTGSGLSPELAGCVMDQIDEPTLERIIVTSFTSGEEALDSDADLTSAFESAATNCASQGIT
jgi:hypothetical protein